MGGYAVAAPLNAAGPWGTVAWVIVGTGLTIAAAAGLMELSKSRETSTTTSTTTTATKTKTETCRQYYAVRIHAQGVDCGGTSSSTIGAPPVIQTIPVLVVQGLALSLATRALLTRTQLKNRTLEIPKAEAYIVRGPTRGGYYGPKSFVNPLLRGGIRYDVDCYGCGNSFVA